MTAGDIIGTGAALGEMGVLCAAAFAGFRRWGYTFAEAGAFAVVSVMMVLSFLFQSAFLTGSLLISLAVEGLLVSLALVVIWRLRPQVIAALRTVRGAAVERRYVVPLLILGFCPVALKGLLTSPSERHWDYLAQVLLLKQEGSLWGAAALLPEAPLIPLNHAVLTHFTLRFHTEWGLGLWGLLSYWSIALATYALARRHSWAPTAFAATLVVASLPRLVHQAATPGCEILPVAAALFTLLAVYRVVEQPNAGDLILACLGLFFSISGGSFCLAFPAILALLTAVLLFRRHGAAAWWFLLKRHRWAALASLLPAAVFSQGWLFLYNFFYRSRWVGSPQWAEFTPNGDALRGALDNIVRYLLESLHVTLPVDRLVQWLAGVSVTDMLQGIYGLWAARFPGGIGAAEPFVVFWNPYETCSWFGPLGVFLIVPAVLYTLFQGSRRLKAIAVALVGYVYVVALAAAWQPGNTRFFTVFFVFGGFFVAFFLPPWRFSTSARRKLQGVSLLLLFYASLSGLSPFLASGAGVGRTPKPADLPAGSFPPGTTVELAFPGLASIYPYLLNRPDLRFIPVPDDDPDHGNHMPHTNHGSRRIKAAETMTEGS